jgi:hypothetical protein
MFTIASPTVEATSITVRKPDLIAGYPVEAVAAFAESIRGQAFFMMTGNAAFLRSLPPNIGVIEDK